MKLMKYISMIIIALLLFSASLFPLSGDEALQKLKAKMASISSITGNISLSYQSGETYSGIFKYLWPGKIYIKLTSPSEKTIISNGKKLWVYDSGDVCGVQELEIEETDPATGTKKTKIGGRSGLAFLSGYAVAESTEDTSGYNIELANETKFYTNIKLIISRDFIPVKISFKDNQDKGFSIRLSDVKTGVKLAPGIFDFNVPSNAQVVKNPLDFR